MALKRLGDTLRLFLSELVGDGDPDLVSSGKSILKVVSIGGTGRGLGVLGPPPKSFTE